MRGCFKDIRPTADEVKPPLRIASFIVRRPCFTALGSLFVAVILASEGNRAGFSGAEELSDIFPQQDYPVYDTISQQTDAVIMAMEQSEENFALRSRRRALSARFTAPSATGARRFLSSSGVQHLQRAAARFDGAEMGDRAVAGAGEPAFERGRELSSTPINQTKQTESLGEAIFSFGAREDGGDSFSEAGLAELCRMHVEMMETKDYDQFCLRSEFETPDVGVLPDATCKAPRTPLVFFYGPTSYDPESALAKFNVPNFEEIMAWQLDPANTEAVTGNAYVAADNAATINSKYTIDVTAADYTTVDALRVQLSTDGPIGKQWFYGRTRCGEGATEGQETAKDAAAVKKLVAKVRGSKALSDSQTGGLVNFYFDSAFGEDNLRSRYTRSFYQFGAPLAGFDNYIESDLKDDQDKLVTDWWKEEDMRGLYSKNGRLSWNEIEPSAIITLGDILLNEFLEIIKVDGILAIVPIVAVFLIVWLHTGSLLIAFATLTEQLLSFFVAFFFTAVVLQIKWLSFQFILSIYIVLAIGADDTFVFVDAWKQSFYAGPDVNRNLATRMSWVYRRAGLAMLITSLTTCAAFLATAVASGQVPDLQLFGIFTAFVIFIDYVLVMTFLTAIMVLYHNRFEMKPGLCCACCGTADTRQGCSKGGCDALCASSSKLETTTAIAERGGADQVAKPRLVTFFEDVFPFSIIRRPPARAASVVIMLAVLAPMAWQASQLEPQKDAAQILPDDHPFQRFFDLSAEFETSNEDEPVKLSVVWGFEDKPLDTDGVNRLFDPQNKGRLAFSTDWVLDESAQSGLLSACDLLENSELVFDKETEAGSLEKDIDCWVRDFKNWRNTTRNEIFPVPDDADVVTAVKEWCDAGDGETASDCSRYVGFEVDANGDLYIAWTRVVMGVKMNENVFLPASKLREKYDEYEGLVDSINEAVINTTLGDAFQVAVGAEDPGGQPLANNKWINMVLQELYVRMSTVGVAIGISIAFIVLLVSTRNLLAASISVLSIACALVTVIGITVAMGWELGASEAICLMTLTGFAVDYVVHLSHSYMESTSHSPLERTHDALRDMGISVFWGMLTSFVAALALASCQLQFLSKFGYFFLLTITFAYLWAVLFLMPLLATIGPRSSPPDGKAVPTTPYNSNTTTRKQVPDAIEVA